MTRIITLKTLGSMGRFGNQLFHLATALGLARKFNAQILVPSNWIGRKIFGGFVAELGECDNVESVTLPLDYLPTESEMSSYNALDLFGYFQYNTNLYSSQDLRDWFRIHPKWYQKFPFKQNQSIVCHVRRGDYVFQPTLYCSIMDNSYDRIIRQLRYNPEEDVYWCTEENPQIDNECISLGIPFLPDFMTCLHAQTLIRSNSTFSMMAGWIGNGNIYSPMVNDLVGWQDVDFIKGNYPKCASSLHHSVLLEDMNI